LPQLAAALTYADPTLLRVSMRQHASAYGVVLASLLLRTAYVSIRQHASAYVSICQLMTAYAAAHALQLLARTLTYADVC
jgi:hypothetical protein